MSTEKDFEKEKLLASWCWGMASRISNQESPVLQKITDAIESFLGKDPSNFLPTRKKIGEICDRLIIIPDLSVQVMTLTALWFLRHRSKHIGFISTLISSKERGEQIYWKTGQSLGEEPIERQANSYLLNLLNFQEARFFERIERSVNHWQEVLEGEIDQFNHPKREQWLERNIGNKVTQKEIKAKAKKSYEESLEFFKQDIELIMEEVGLVDFVAIREKEIKQDLRTILAYNFSVDQNPTITIAVMKELSWISSINYYPERWLLEAVDDVLLSTNLSPVLEAMVI